VTGELDERRGARLKLADRVLDLGRNPAVKPADLARPIAAYSATSRPRWGR